MSHVVQPKDEQKTIELFIVLVLVVVVIAGSVLSLLSDDSNPTQRNSAIILTILSGLQGIEAILNISDRYRNKSPVTHPHTFFARIKSIFRYRMWLLVFIAFIAGWNVGPWTEWLTTGQMASTEVGDFTWGSDEDTIYIYLSHNLFSYFSHYEKENVDVIAKEIIANVPKKKAPLISYAQCVTWKVAEIIRSDSRFSLANNVRSIDYTIKYYDDSIWIRPWGGPETEKWIEFNKIGCGFSGKTRG